MNNEKSSDSVAARPVNSSKFDFQVFGALLLASLIASLATIPYASALLYQDSTTPIPEMLLGGLFNFVLLTLPLASLGLWLGPKVGLGVLGIEAIQKKVPQNYRRLQSSILPAIILGTVGGIFVRVVSVLSEPYLPEELAQIKPPGLVASLLGSFGAAINEEIWLRLGIMTCIVCLATVLINRPKPGKAIIWGANLLAAFGFGMLHLPLAAIFAQGLPLLVVILVLLLNGFVGVIFGWLYWRHGLLAAIIAHFSTNIIIHVMPALFSTTAN